MNPESQDFTQLRRLLALKRHEQPPPGYFNDFSRQVLERISLAGPGEQNTSLSEMMSEVPWLQRLWAVFETKPILAGAFGVVVCGFLGAAFLFSERIEPPTFSFASSAPGVSELAQGATIPASGLAKVDLPDYPSTAGVPTMPTRASLFDDIPRFQAQPVTWKVPNGQ